MKNPHLTIRFMFMFAFALSCCFAGQAQNRFFVSALGSDANPCTRPSPCRTFQKAHDVAASGGEVIALDPAGYGQLSITKSISIIGDRVYAGISASSGNAISIATPGITVTLRSLTLDGLGTATDGILATDFAALHIENCIVNGFSNIGIYVFPAGGGTRKAFIKDSIVRNNGSSGLVLFNNGGTALTATVEDTLMDNNFGAGLVAAGSNATVTASRCIGSGNGADGFVSSSNGVLNIERSVASSNGTGIGTNSIVRVSNSTVTNNSLFGFNNNGGTFESRGNNTVGGNNGGAAQTSGMISPLTAL